MANLPINHISSGIFTYGDSISDLQAHVLRDTTRFAVGTYDSIDNRTRVDIFDKDAAKIGNFSDIGKHKKTVVVCHQTIIVFILEDVSGNEKKIRLNAININIGQNRIVQPSTITGVFSAIEATENPCGIRISYKDS